MSGLPDYSLFEPSVMTFVVIPIALMVLLIWAVAAAWRAAGRPAASVRLTALATLAISVVWLNVTWSLAQGGVLAQWDRTPPPFMVLVVVMLCWLSRWRSVVSAADLRSTSPSGRWWPSNPFGCRWSPPCTAWRSAASCRRR